VVEQNCIFLDMDNKDQASYHLRAGKNDHLVAYARIVPAGICYVESSIGRIVTSRSLEGKDTAELWCSKALRRCILSMEEGHTHRCAILSEEFYESFGFRQMGEIYLEDGIEHIEMLLSASA